MKTSPLFSINLRDFLHGLIIAAGTAAFTIIENSLNAETFNIKWKQVAFAALAGGLTYIGKKFFTQTKNPSETK